MPLHVHECHIGAQLLLKSFQPEIEEGNQINGLDVILPLAAALALLNDGAGRVIDAAVLEMPIFSLSRYWRSTTCRSPSSRLLRKVIITGLDISCPKMRLKPMSVNGLMNFAIV